MQSKILPRLTRQDDFNAFWRETLNELTTIDSTLRQRPVIMERKGIVFQEILFQSLHHLTIHGSLLCWRDDRPRPLIIYTHGYNDQCSDIYWHWADAGANVLGFDTRGFGESRSQHLPLSEHGYIISGIESPQSSVLRGAVCDFIQAAKAAQAYLTNRVTTVTFYGYSFAGAMALMSQALTHQANSLVVGVPTFGWTEGRRRLTPQGSSSEMNAYLSLFPQEEARAMRTLSYFDPMNFADLLPDPMLIGLGIDDPIVPPATVFAIINHMRYTPEVRVFPVSHSTSKQEALWKLFEDEWLAGISQAVAG